MILQDSEPEDKRIGDTLPINNSAQNVSKGTAGGCFLRSSTMVTMLVRSMYLFSATASVFANFLLLRQTEKPNHINHGTSCSSS